MPGMIIQVAAAPGVGKTTLLLPILDSIVLNNPELNVGYISGEEDVTQLAYNAARIGVKHVLVANMSNVDKICDEILPKFNVIVIDSFQTLQSKLVKGKNKVQMYAISRLVKACKDTKCIVFTICHQTKDGKAKGDSGVTHAVDATVYITKGNPDQYEEHSRIITVDKNRFGQNGSVVLKMTPTGYDFANPL
jgi:predicted ATP-dependent serine protease